MTKEVAIEINDLLLKRAKDETLRGNERDWEGKRCALCGNYFAEGDWLLFYIPQGYYSRRIIDDSHRVHVECLDGHDRWNFKSGIHVASYGQPLLIRGLLYAIIYRSKEDANVAS